MKITVGNVVSNLRKKEQKIDTTRIKQPNQYAYFRKRWNHKCNDENNSSKIPNFIKSPKPALPTSNAGSTTLLPNGNCSMHNEISQIGSASESVFVSFERRDIIQNNNIAFFSQTTSTKRFSIQLKNS